MRKWVIPYFFFIIFMSFCCSSERDLCLFHFCRYVVTGVDDILWNDDITTEKKPLYSEFAISNFFLVGGFIYRFSDLSENFIEVSKMVAYVCIDIEHDIFFILPFYTLSVCWCRNFYLIHKVKAQLPAKNIVKT